jgi:HEAT repeat protein
MAALCDPDPSVRAHAAFELSLDHRPSPAAISALARVLEDNDDEPRREAVAALISMGQLDSTNAGAVIGAMISLISRPSAAASARVQAIRVLSQLGTSSRAARDPLLIALLGHDDTLRAAAADAMGQIGFTDAETLSALDRAVDDTVPDVRAAALESLARLRPGDAPRAAARQIADTSVTVRLTAVYTLAVASRYDGPVGRAIDIALRDSVPEIRRAAVMALTRLAPDAKSTRDRLQRLSSDPVASVRQAAREALRATGSLPE